MTSQFLTCGSSLVLKTSITRRTRSHKATARELKEGGLFYVLEHALPSWDVPYRSISLVSSDYYEQNETRKDYQSFIFSEEEILKFFRLQDYRELETVPILLGQIWKYAIPLYNMRVMINFSTLADPRTGCIVSKYELGKHTVSGGISDKELRSNYFLEHPGNTGNIVF